MCSQAIDSMISIRNGNVAAETGNIFISGTNTGSKLQMTNLLIKTTQKVYKDQCETTDNESFTELKTTT